MKVLTTLALVVTSLTFSSCASKEDNGKAKAGSCCSAGTVKTKGGSCCSN